MSVLFGKYGKFYSVAGFISRPPEKIVQKVKKKLKRYYDEISDSEVDSWKDSYPILADAFNQLPEDYGNLWIFLEYIIPNKKPGSDSYNNGKHCRADAVLLSADKVLVLEFKQTRADRSDLIEKHVKKTNHYGVIIRKYHDESVGMEIRCIVVETWAEPMQTIKNGIHVCSKDKLTEEILAFMGEHPQTHLFPKQWAESNYSIREEQ